jgi:dihydroxy-acid dehydratase
MRQARAFAAAGAQRSQDPAHDDVIEIDARQGVGGLRLSGAELAAHKKPWTPRQHEFGSRAFWKYAQLVGPARAGTVTYPGGVGET